MRVETNFTSFATIRQYTGTNNVLSEILHSPELPTIRVFDKITKSVNGVNLKLLLSWDGMKFQDIERLEGRKSIIRALDFDMVKIKTFIRSRVSGNVSRYIRFYRELCNEMRRDEITPNEDILKEIRNHMKVA
jgi:hypothetical protein